MTRTRAPDGLYGNSAALSSWAHPITFSYQDLLSHTLHLFVVVVDNPAALAVIAQRPVSIPSLGAVYDLAPGFVGLHQLTHLYVLP